MTGQSLTRRERVRRRPEFERIYTAGSKVHGRFMTLFVMQNGTSAPRFGVAATRKLGPIPVNGGSPSARASR